MNNDPSTTASGPETLTEWVDRYGSYLYRFALTRVKSPQTAEDLVQETFLAALKGWDGFEKRASGKTWLTAILKHKIIDFIRKDVRETPSDRIEAMVDATDALFSPKGEWSMAPKHWEIDPGRILEQKEFMTQLDHCLADLPERMARAFTLREMDGLSTPEICEILNISESNSWVILYRARMALRKCLEARWQTPAPATGSAA
ncbi:MAG: sigma-70 family RNA polymerase sigma factor [Pseudomonadota bacterium]